MTKEHDSPIKIIDFGLSRVFGDDIFEIENELNEERRK